MTLLTGWGEYMLAWAAFPICHALPVRPPVRSWFVARIGSCGFAVAYSALSVLLLVWLIGAADRAPFMEVWPRLSWQSWITQGSMLAACAVLTLAAFRPNPLSFGGWQNNRFDPARPGIVGWMRHPVLAALALWSAGHLAPNGDLAHVLLFGGFAGFALLGMAMIDRRRRRALGTREWARLTAGAGHLPRHAGWRMTAAVALWSALAALHPVVIGRAALPGF